MLLYASPAWIGFLNANLLNMIEAFLLKSKRFGYCPRNMPSFQTLCQTTDQKLFNSIISNSCHVLYHLLPPINQHSYNLRARPHNFTLPLKDNRNFLSRMLFTNIFWLLQVISFFIRLIVETVFYPKNFTIIFFI